MTDVPVGGHPWTRPDTPADYGLVVRATTEWVFANDHGQARRIPSEVASVFRAGNAEVSDATPTRA